MTIEKRLNGFNRYDIKLTNDSKELTIRYAGNDDLYLLAGNGQRLKQDEDFFIAFYFLKEDETLYPIIDKLYKNINIIGNRDLIKPDGSIVWISDDGIEEFEDKLVLAKREEYYRLLFHRNNKMDPTKRKSSRNIVVRISNSGNRYKDTANLFMDMYKDLEEIEKPKVLEK